MSMSLQFVIGLTLTLLVALVVVRYLTTPLRKQLVELCGTADRAEFWTAFSNVTLVLAPVIFSMQFQPTSDSGVPPIFTIVGQLKWGLAGLILSVLWLRWILGRFIRRVQSPITTTLRTNVRTS